MDKVFNHSIRVPRLYKLSSKVLQDVRENGLGLKEGLFKCKHPNVKGIQALVAETIRHFSQINQVIEMANLSEKEPQLDLWLARILILEMLWRNRDLKGECKPVKTILNYRRELAKHKANLNIPENETRVNQKPRFVRVNTLKLSVEDAINGFCYEGWNFVDFPSTDYKEFLSQVTSLNYDQFMLDIHIKELLIFPTKTEFYAHNAYREKEIVLQDKASCLPVHLLNPPPNSVVLDMCAAPGMKTCYLAALLENKGVVYAIERNTFRFNLMANSLKELGATCVKAINNDALKITAEDCPNVEYILVDPSCSGTGMTERVLFDNKEEVTKDRLKSLAGFQIIILKHALTHFPQAKRVVYSTCSIYREENEDVVEDVLKSARNFKLVSAKRLLNKEEDLNVEEESISEKCINFNFNNDLTNGFFIAVFERIESQPSEADAKLNKRRQREIRRELRAKLKLEENLEESNQEQNENKRTEEEETEQLSEVQEESKPKKKKNKKRKKDIDEEDNGESISVKQSEIEGEISNQEKSEKKKRKKQKESEAVPSEEEAVTEQPRKKKKKKKEHSD